MKRNTELARLSEEIRVLRERPVVSTNVVTTTSAQRNYELSRILQSETHVSYARPNVRIQQEELPIRPALIDLSSKKTVVESHSRQVTESNLRYRYT